MANIYKNAGFALSTTNLTTIYTVPSNRTAIVKSIQINNDDASAIQTEISVTDSSASTTYKIYHKDLAADTTDNGVVAPLVLESGDIIKIQVATANKIEGMIADAMASSNNYANASHFKQWISEGKMQLWFLWDKEADIDQRLYGIVVTEVIQRPLQRCLNIKIMTGKHRDKWQHLIKHIEDFAWQNNCDLLELVARPGWKRVLKPFGYKESHVLLEKHKEK